MDAIQWQLVIVIMMKEHKEGYLIQIKASLIEPIDQTMVTNSVVGVIFGVAVVQQSIGSIADQMTDQFQIIL